MRTNGVTGAGARRICGLRTRIVQDTLGRWCSSGALVLVLTTMGSAHAAEYSILVRQALTGPAAFLGVSLRDGILLAVDDANGNRELGPGVTLRPIIVDDASDRTLAISLIQRYAADSSVLMGMGPTAGASAIGGANAANDLKFPIITSTNSTGVLKAGPWSYIATQPPGITVPYLVTYAVDKLKVKTCTVIGIRDSETYLALQRTFEDGVKARGVLIDAVETIKSSDSDFSFIATKVASRKQDCIFISATAPQAANIVLQLRQSGIDQRTHILGHVALGSPQFLQRGGASVENVYVMGDWLVGGWDEAARAFSRTYRTKSMPRWMAGMQLATARCAWQSTRSGVPAPIQAASRFGPRSAGPGISRSSSAKESAPWMSSACRYTV